MGTRRRRRPRRRRRRPLHRTQRRRRSPESPTSPESPGRQCRRRRRRRRRHRHRRQTTEQPLPSRRSRQVGWVAAAGWEAVVAWEAEEGWEGREAVAPALPPTSPSSRPPGKPPPAGSAPSDAERPHPSWAPRASVLRACLRRTRKAGIPGGANRKLLSRSNAPRLTHNASHNLWVWDWFNWGGRFFFFCAVVSRCPPRLGTLI